MKHEEMWSLRDRRSAWRGSEGRHREKRVRRVKDSKRCDYVGRRCVVARNATEKREYEKMSASEREREGKTGLYARRVMKSVTPR